jgi:hypothetical protein
MPLFCKAKAKVLKKTKGVIDNNGGLAKIPNQPFKTKREALRVIHLSVLNKHLNSFKEYKGLLIFSFSQHVRG